jgi:hypothetical protein
MASSSTAKKQFVQVVKFPQTKLMHIVGVK